MIQKKETQNFCCILTKDSLSCNTAFDFCKDEKAGDVVLFCGTTRNNEKGKLVTHLSYSCCEELCINMMETIANECLSIKGIHKVYIAHRIDSVKPKEISIICGVSSSHREEGYKVCKDLLDKCKERLAIWKLEHYDSGETEWKENIIKKEKEVQE